MPAHTPSRHRPLRKDAARAAPEPPTIPVRGVAQVAVVVVAVTCVALLVTFRMSTPDVWQHVLVGRALWELGRVPHEHLWTWPSYGTPEVLFSWAFRAVLWPFYRGGGEMGLQVWRWLTTLGALGLAWAAARALGARGIAPIVVLVACALPYRTRSQVRPETLVAVLLALELWLLERRRARGGGSLALVTVAWGWANVHISYYLGLMLLGIHLVASLGWYRRRTEATQPTKPDSRHASNRSAASSTDEGEQNLAGTPMRAPGGLAAAWSRIDHAPMAFVLVAALAISFVHPFGWRALWQPFEYFLVWRHEPVYQPIPELASIASTWRTHLRSGLLVIMALWPLVVVWRPRGRAFDRVEALTCLAFTALALMNQRFAGFLMIAAAPYLARDVAAWSAAIRWPRPLLAPGRRAAIAIAAIIGLSLTASGQSQFPFGTGFIATCYPGPACDFIARHDLRGRVFNPYYFGGYILWRFWPQHDRLPFMDIHQTGTPEDRELYAFCFADPDVWKRLDDRHHFEIALLDGHQDWIVGDHLIDFLDADPEWALLFRDDASALFVRRRGRLARLADSLAYRIMPGGADAFEALGPHVARDPELRHALLAEVQRMAASSPLSAQAHSHLANLAFMDGDRAAARRELDAALHIDSHLYGAHRRLGYLLMDEQRWREAIREFEREQRIGGTPADECQRLALCWEALGNRRRATEWFQKELVIHSENSAAREGLKRVGGAP